MTTVNEVYSPVEQNLDKAEFIKIRSLVEKYPVISSFLGFKGQKRYVTFVLQYINELRCFTKGSLFSCDDDK